MFFPYIFHLHFFLIFFYVFAVFPFSITHLPYMEIYNGPWEYHLMSSPTISIFLWQALDPCLRHGARWRSAVPGAQVTACRGHAPWTPWYTCFIPVLAHMLHPSAGTHLSSFGTALTDVRLCLGAGTMPPASVLMFNPSYGTHLSSYRTVLTDAQLCLGFSISPISIQLHIFTGPM